MRCIKKIGSKHILLWTEALSEKPGMIECTKDGIPVGEPVSYKDIKTENVRLKNENTILRQELAEAETRIEILSKGGKVDSKEYLSVPEEKTEEIDFSDEALLEESADNEPGVDVSEEPEPEEEKIEWTAEWLDSQSRETLLKLGDEPGCPAGKVKLSARMKKEAIINALLGEK